MSWLFCCAETEMDHDGTLAKMPSPERASS